MRSGQREREVKSRGRTRGSQSTNGILSFSPNTHLSIQCFLSLFHRHISPELRVENTFLLALKNMHEIHVHFLHRCDLLAHLSAHIFNPQPVEPDPLRAQSVRIHTLTHKHVETVVSWERSHLPASLLNLHTPLVSH